MRIKKTFQAMVALLVLFSLIGCEAGSISSISNEEPESSQTSGTYSQTTPTESSRVQNTVSETDIYVEFVKGIPTSGSQYDKDYNRFMLYNCNGDGKNELLTMYLVDENNENVWGCVKKAIYTVDSFGELKTLYEPNLESLAGAGNSAFYKISIDGKSYLSSYYENGEIGTTGYSGTYTLLVENKECLVPAHNIRYEETFEMDSEGNTTSDKYCYFFDINEITEDEYNAIIKTQVLLSSIYEYSDDECLSKSEFLAQYD